MKITRRSLLLSTALSPFAAFLSGCGFTRWTIEENIHRRWWATKVAPGKARLFIRPGVYDNDEFYDMLESAGRVACGSKDVSVGFSREGRTDISDQWRYVWRRETDEDGNLLPPESMGFDVGFNDTDKPWIDWDIETFEPTYPEPIVWRSEPDVKESPMPTES